MGDEKTTLELADLMEQVGEAEVAIRLRELAARVEELEAGALRFMVIADALLDSHFEYMDLDGLDREALLIEVGVLERTTATAEDAKQDWALEWDIDEGDPCTKWTDLGARIVSAMACRAAPRLLELPDDAPSPLEDGE